jgi:hypothetical protein
MRTGAGGDLPWRPPYNQHRYFMVDRPAPLVRYSRSCSPRRPRGASPSQGAYPRPVPARRRGSARAPWPVSGKRVRPCVTGPMPQSGSVCTTFASSSPAARVPRPVPSGPAAPVQSGSEDPPPRRDQRLVLPFLAPVPVPTVVLHHNPHFPGGEGHIDAVPANSVVQRTALLAADLPLRSRDECPVQAFRVGVDAGPAGRSCSSFSTRSPSDSASAFSGRRSRPLDLATRTRARQQERD